MPTAWRLTKSKYLDDALSGEGAFVFGARWTSRGHRAVYAAATTSLAILEVLAHLDDARPLGAYALISLEFPEALVTAISRGELPSDWRDYPAPVALQGLGDAWLASGRSAVLRVPSAIVPDVGGGEVNYVLNPVHPDFSKIGFGEPLDLNMDPRL